MNDEAIQRELTRISGLIDSGEFIRELARVTEWGGADVIITSEPAIDDLPQRLVIGFSEGEPDASITGDFRIVTEHAKSLSWLFCELRDAFGARINFKNKYDFYGRLARRASSYLDSKIDGASSAKDLLTAVLNEAQRFLD